MPQNPRYAGMPQLMYAGMPQTCLLTPPCNGIVVTFFNIQLQVCSVLSLMCGNGKRQVRSILAFGVSAVVSLT